MICGSTDYRLTLYNVTRYTPFMSETRTFKGGDTFQLTGGTTITLGTRRSAGGGVRWTWGIPDVEIYGQGYAATPEEAIANAEKGLAAGECRHGQFGWCHDCHDGSNR